MRNFTFLILSLMIFSSSSSFSQSPGEQTFTQVCRACHTVGMGKLVGPDLMNVHKKRSEQWMLEFIKSSTSMINKGDTGAVNIFNQYNKVVMPDQNFSDAQIKEIITYLIEYSPKAELLAKTRGPIDDAANVTNTQGKSLKEITKEDVELGKKLFEGSVAFKNGGIACISCHNVNHEKLIGGGLLAKDLSAAYSRLGGAVAIHTIISNPPFPAMKVSFENSPITKNEAFYLTAFLKSANADSAFQHPAIDYKTTVIYSGAIGGLGLVFIYGIIWFNRKRKSVNADIYSRQIKAKF